MLAIKIIITISQTVCLPVLSISQSPCLQKTNLAPSVSLGVSPCSASLPPATHSCLPFGPSLGRPGLSPGLPFGLASFSCGMGESVWPPGQWDRQVGFPTCCPPSCPAPKGCGQHPLGPGHMSAAVISMGRRHRPGSMPADSAASGISLETVVGEGSCSSKGRIGREHLRVTRIFQRLGCPQLLPLPCPYSAGLPPHPPPTAVSLLPLSISFSVPH